MNIGTKILLLFILGAVVPLVVSHFFVITSATTMIETSVSKELLSLSSNYSGRVEEQIERSLADVSIATNMVPFESFPAEDLHRALEIPYRQLPGVAVVALFDEEGKAVAAPYYLAGQAAKSLGRDSVSEVDLEVFAVNVPLRLALSAEVAIGPIYRSAYGVPRMAIAKAFPLSDGEHSWVLVVEISLEKICGVVAGGLEDKGRQVWIVDMEGQLVCNPTNGKDDPQKTVQSAGQVLEMPVASVQRLRSGTPEAVLAVVSDIDATNWRILIEQSEKIALAPVRLSLKWAALWVAIALVIAMGGGALFARGLTSPIARLEKAATDIAGGDYDRRIVIESTDEIGRLAGAFNLMSAEIKTWNTELTERVDERTRALREAQEQIIQTQKLAAVGELGSGVAHEINNPLTGVIGNAQLLRMEAQPGSEMAEGLDDIIGNARRVAEVVSVLLRFTQSQSSEKMKPVDGKDLLENVLNMFSGRIAEREAEIETFVGPDIRLIANEGDIRLALHHLIDNALAAIDDGGLIGFRIEKVDGGAIQITIKDNGSGMKEEVRTRVFDPFYTTNSPGSGSQGLGLPMVHRIVEEHDGKIVLDSEVGTGTTITIYLPGAARLSKD
jgi:two-component system, NtrC family, sensor kinase